MKLWPQGGSEEVHKGKPRMGSLKIQLPPTPAPDRPNSSSLPLRQQQGPEEFVLVTRVGELFIHGSTPSDNTNGNGLCFQQWQWLGFGGKECLAVRIHPVCGSRKSRVCFLVSTCNKGHVAKVRVLPSQGQEHEVQTQCPLHFVATAAATGLYPISQILNLTEL